MAKANLIWALVLIVLDLAGLVMSFVGPSWAMLVTIGVFLANFLLLGWVLLIRRTSRAPSPMAESHPGLLRRQNTFEASVSSLKWILAACLVVLFAAAFLTTKEEGIRHGFVPLLCDKYVLGLAGGTPLNRTLYVLHRSAFTVFLHVFALVLTSWPLSIILYGKDPA